MALIGVDLCVVEVCLVFYRKGRLADNELNELSAFIGNRENFVISLS
jgi:hypothetical protein